MSREGHWATRFLHQLQSPLLPHIHSVFGDPLKTSVAMSPVALPWSSVGLGFWKPIQLRYDLFTECVASDNRIVGTLRAQKVLFNT